MKREIDENILLFTPRFVKQRDYWLKKLSGNEDSQETNFFPGRKKRNEPGKNREAIPIAFREDLNKRLLYLSKGSDLSLYIILLTIVKILTYRYTDQEDIVIVSPLHKQKVSEETINNSVFIRVRLRGDMTVKEVILDTRKSVLEAYENQDYPSYRLQESREGGQRISGIVCSLDSIHDSRNIESLLAGDIVFSFEREGGVVSGKIIYPADSYETYCMEGISRHFVNLLDKSAADVGKKISVIFFLSETERKELLYDFNDTGADYPGDKTIHRLFEEQAERTPGHTAVNGREQGGGGAPPIRGRRVCHLAYRELNEKSNRLAYHLQSRGVEPGTIVGIMVEHSINMIIGILGILKAGGAYLPIDPDYPRERIDYMLKDSNALLLLTGGDFTDFCKGTPAISPATCNLHLSLAYVIYTSGSTGKPKGVMITHKSVVNYIYWAARSYVKNEKVNFPLYTSISFDLTVTSIFTPLTTGNSVVVYNDENKELALERIIEEGKVEAVKITPSHLKLIKYKTVKNSTVKRFIVGGEELEAQLARDIYSKFGGKIEIINEYGPTEAAVGCMLHKFEPGEDKRISVPLGTPAANTGIYILDGNLVPVPAGAVGEMYISGEGLAAGYLNRQGLTAEKFVDNPFEEGQRIYKTGDLARWVPGGNIEFLGRLDRQVKIRGFRVELAEIEKRLLQIDSLREAVVVERRDENGEKYLCGYMVAGGQVSSPEIKQILAGKLPHYMIPSYLVQLEEMPLTLNGKIDIKALPDPVIEAGDDYIAPRDELENRLAEIWSDLLHINKEAIGIGSNFFELGGHSLTATILSAKLHKEFDIKMSLSDIFRLSTIESLSGYLKNNSAEDMYAAIVLAEEKEYYPLSSSQKRLYVLQLLELESTGYNIPAIMQVEGKVSREKLATCFKKLIQRHESLRTSFQVIEGDHVQWVCEDVEFEIEYLPSRSSLCPEVIFKDFVRPFDLSRPPLVRIGLAAVSAQEYLLMTDMHHIISDGMSVDILVKDFIKLYQGEELPTLPLRYRDYSQWQNSREQREAIKQQEFHWLKEFEGEIPVLQLPTDYSRPPIQGFEGSTLEFGIGEEETGGFKRISRESGATMFMVLLAVTGIFAAKLSRQEDIVIGTPAAGRRHADLEQVIGVFVNTLPLRNFPAGNKTFREFLAEVRKRTLEAFENQEYQFEDLVDKVVVARDMSRNPLFDMMFAIRDIAVEPVEALAKDFSDIELRPYEYQGNTSKFDLSLDVSIKKSLSCTFEFSTKLFKRETIQRFAAFCRRIAAALTRDPDIIISEIEIITEEEKKQILVEFNDTRASYPVHQVIHRLFECQAEKTPDKPAVVFRDHRLTYRELNRRANRWGRYLRSRGAGPETITAIMVERSLEMIIAVIALQKAGGAYLPVEPSLPLQRIRYMLEDSGVTLLLAQKELTGKVNFNGGIIDIHEDRGNREDTANLQPVNQSGDLAYVIYTSGSTGKPKGVMVQHDQYVNAAFAWRNEYHLGEMENNILQMAAFSFDVFAGDLVRALLNGGTLVICPEEEKMSLDSLYRLIRKHLVSLFESTPPLIIPLMEYVYENRLEIDNLNLLILGSESFRVEDFRKLVSRFGNQMRIINSYGVTEAAIDSSYYEAGLYHIPSTGNVPIGKPMPNMNFYIMDAGGKLQPIGIPGELYIGGSGVARGYLNRPELTAERFVNYRSYRIYSLNFSKKLYKTGDLARWLPDGCVVFLGRSDYQVKIRGYRIETGEIENQLLKHPGVKETVLQARGSGGADKYLCAYIVSTRKPPPAVSQLKEWLTGYLPDYMLPSHFLFLDKMPLAPGGKIDRKALPDPEFKAGETYAAPSDPMEEELVRIWSEILGIEKDVISVNANFFDLGGHSLKATLLISAIHKALDAKVPLVQIFKTPTIKGTANYIKGSEKDKYVSIPPTAKKDYYELSSAQKRLYFLQQLDKNNIFYNMPSVVILEGRIDKERLGDTFKKLVSRHESLRTSFHLLEDDYVQGINDNIPFAIEYYGHRDRDEEESIRDFIRPFDLSCAPLLRVGLIKCEEMKHILMVDMHHIISDGASMVILVNEFITLYEGQDLPELKIQYKDFSQWQNKLLLSEETRKQEEFWLGLYKDKIPVLNILTDYPRPLIRKFAGSIIYFEIDKEFTAEIMELGTKRGCTLFMILLSAYCILLAKYSEQEDIVVASAISGRAHADLQDVIGMFVNMLALRTRPEGHKAYSRFLGEVKKISLAAFQNQDYQFDQLIARLGLQGNSSGNPLCEAVFALQNVEDGNIDYHSPPNGSDLKIYPYEHKNRIAKFDLLMVAVEANDVIRFSLEYSTELFTHHTADRILESYIEILKQIISDNEIVLKEIAISHRLMAVKSDILEADQDEFNF